jgi:uracil-DNA glycosylase
MRSTPEHTAMERLLAEIRACSHCAAHLPLGPRPMIFAGVGARIVVIGQAPGTKVHATGLSWNDPSGDRLRAWMGVDRETFYDSERIALMPMGFCYPGRLPRGGDCPPRPECAPMWHPRLLEKMPHVGLTLLIGQYAQARYLGDARRRTLTETVRHWRDYAPGFLPLPHPSFRNNRWLQQHGWFAREVVPELRSRVAALLA